MENAVNIRGINSEALAGAETEIASNLRRVEQLQNLLSLPILTPQSGKEIIEQARALLADIAASLDVAGGAFTE